MSITDERPGFLAINDYLRLPRDPETWLIKPLIPSSGSALLYGEAKRGKALALDTPIPTPSGWRIMADLAVGDIVFDSGGKSTRIIATSPIQHDRICYRITFSDHTSIIADAEHRWAVTKTGKACKFCNPPKVFTTQELLGKGVTSNSWMTKNGYTFKKYTWHVQLPEPLVYTPLTSSLLLDPYCLGTWLGDGASSGPNITSNDPEILTYWADAGWTPEKRSDPYNYYIGHYSGPGVLLNELRTLGILNNKHIPEEYLRASIPDRIALLQGLLDTDGYAKKGVGFFYNMNKLLAKQTYELAVGLGAKVTLSEKRATLRGKDCGICYVVKIRAPFNPFRLKRKANEFILNTENYQTIIAIEPITSVPVKCIAVDAPDHLFLAGKNCIPTHNTSLALQLAAALSGTADNWLGFTIPQHGRVLYLQLDTPRSTWSMRFENLIKAGFKFTDNLLLADRECLAYYPFDILKKPELINGVRTQGHMEYLHDLVRKWNPIAVVVDTLRESHSGDENNSTDMQNVIANLVGAVHPAALILISHDRKPNPDADKSLMADHRGSSYVTGRMDAIMRLTATRLYYGGRSIEEGHIKLERQDVDGALLWAVTEDQKEAEILQNVLNNPELTSLRQKAKVAAPLLKCTDEAAMSKLRRRVDALKPIKPPKVLNATGGLFSEK